MGRRIAALAVENGGFEIVAAIEADGHPDLGKDIGTLAGVGELAIPVSAELDQARPDVVIDFSLPEGTMKHLPTFVDAQAAVVIGTTGLSEQQTATIAQAAQRVPIVHAANMSVGINLLLKLVAQAASALGEDYDIEIVESHHRFKKDAPSGTAIALAKSICSATGKNYAAVAQHGREGACPRNDGEIGMHAVRLGDTVGEHDVHFGNLGETITIRHSAHTRDTFVRGALRAATWLEGKAPGLYDMHDVLGM
jgi:4-hydroxy-tetrahydrodipicolinate reductase